VKQSIKEHIFNNI